MGSWSWNYYKNVTCRDLKAVDKQKEHMNWEAVQAMKETQGTLQNVFSCKNNFLADHTFSYNIHFVTAAKRQQDKAVFIEIEGEN